MSSNSSAQRALGQAGEDYAAAYLIDHGYVILDRNWRCRHGEIDLIAAIGETIVFAEVKTRSGTGYGHPFEAVTPRKLSRMRLLAGAWCASASFGSRAIRLDVLGVLATAGRPHNVEHLIGVGE